jgi:ATP-dependent Clp protease adaptor protein ClpS
MEIQKIDKPVNEKEVDEEIDIGLEARVALFNDDWHSFDEVISQIMKAIGCTFEQARGYTFEVHVKGKSIIFTGPMSKCLKVTSVLEEIALTTQIIT